MPPQAPPASGGGLGLKRLPPWAWVVAIVGGVVVGFVLLKPGGALSEGEEEGSLGDEEAPAKKGGGGGAPPIPKDELEALGLSPGEYQYASYGDSGSGESSSDGVGGDGFTDYVSSAGAVGPGPTLFDPYIPLATWEANIASYPTSIPGQPVPVFFDPTQGVIPYGGVTSSPASGGPIYQQAVQQQAQATPQSEYTGGIGGTSYVS